MLADVEPGAGTTSSVSRSATKVLLARCPDHANVTVVLVASGTGAS